MVQWATNARDADIELSSKAFGRSDCDDPAANPIWRMTNYFTTRTGELLRSDIREFKSHIKE